MVHHGVLVRVVLQNVLHTHERRRNHGVVTAAGVLVQQLGPHDLVGPWWVHATTTARPADGGAASRAAFEAIRWLRDEVGRTYRRYLLVSFLVDLKEWDGHMNMVCDMGSMSGMVESCTAKPTGRTWLRPC